MAERPTHIVRPLPVAVPTSLRPGLMKAQRQAPKLLSPARRPR